MKAVVLVGGFGTRLRPLTLTRPKQMLTLNGVTMIERVMTTLASHGVDEAVLALGYRPDVFTNAFPDGTISGVRMHYAVESEPLNTGGAIGFAARSARFDETFLAVNGDVLTDLDIGALIELHRSSGAEGTIALTQVDDPSRFGVVPIDSDGRVEAFIEKPPADEAPTDWINAGTYILEASVLARMPEGESISIERAVFPDMVSDGRLFALQAPGYWVDAGTPESYLKVGLDMINGVRFSEYGVSADSGAGPGAVIEDSIVEAGCYVAAGAVVRGSMICEGAKVGVGATVVDSIVGPGAVIGDGCEISEYSVVGDSEAVPDETVLRSARFPSA